MPSPLIYLDNHATTAVDPAVVEVMLRYFTRDYGNAGSTTHRYGEVAREAVEQARLQLADFVGATAAEIVFTSGATESNNLAIRGLAVHSRNRRRHLISVTTEHAAVLGPLARLAREGFEVTHLSPSSKDQPDVGRVDPRQVAAAIREDTLLVSIMLANNEIGVLQPIAEIGDVCQRHGVALHADATQAVGRIPVDVGQLNVSMMSFSAHKLYGPKGIGALYVRRESPRLRLAPLLDGGGQEGGLRSGTLNVPAIAGFGEAVRLCVLRQPGEADRIAAMRDQMYAELRRALPDVTLNGPPLARRDLRLPGNLNLIFPGVQGDALMSLMKDELAVSSGSTCSAANPQPSHVLLGIGLSPDEVRCSLRIGLGRFNQASDVAAAVGIIQDAVRRLRDLRPC